MIDDKKRIGWIGIGVMGEPLCQHLIKAGYALSIHSRSKSKAARLVEIGAHWCETPSQIAENCAIIFTMVGIPDEVRNVYFGEQGLFSTAKSSLILVDMGTTPPSLTRDIDQRASQIGAYAIDAPVSGGDVGAQNATLTIMVGGDALVVESLHPVFDCMSKSLTYMGKSGTGQHTKLCNQLVVAGTMIGVCEALLYAKKSGVNPDELIKAIKPGAAGCWVLDNLAPRIINNDFEPGFMVEHFIKDLGIAISEAKNLGIDLPGLTLAYKLYIETRKLGHGKSGTQALILALENLS